MSNFYQVKSITFSTENIENSTFQLKFNAEMPNFRNSERNNIKSVFSHCFQS